MGKQLKLKTTQTQMQRNTTLVIALAALTALNHAVELEQRMGPDNTSGLLSGDTKMMFKTYDTNRNGNIDAKEFKDLYEKEIEDNRDDDDKWTWPSEDGDKDDDDYWPDEDGDKDNDDYWPDEDGDDKWTWPDEDDDDKDKDSWEPDEDDYNPD